MIYRGVFNNSRVTTKNLSTQLNHPFCMGRVGVAFMKHNIFNLFCTKQKHLQNFFITNLQKHLQVLSLNELLLEIFFEMQLMFYYETGVRQL